MRSVRAWLRADFRSRWRTWLALAVLFGVAGGAVIAAAAGARRTGSVYERFLLAQNAADVQTFDDGGLGTTVDLNKVVRLPQVASYARGGLINYFLGNAAAVAAVDERLGFQINRFKVLRGHMYDPNNRDEVVVGFEAARRYHLHVGSTFPIVDPNELQQIPPDTPKEDIERFRALTREHLRVVGIVAAPGEFPPQYVGLYPSVHLAPAFFRAFGNFQEGGPEGGTLYVKLKRGAADAAAFKEEVEKLAGGTPAILETAGTIGSLTSRSFQFQAFALALLAAFGSVAMLLVVGQAFARQALLGATEFPTLRALGMSRRELWQIGVGRAAFIGAAAAGFALAGAYVLSTLFPAGVPRIAEPHPGRSFDATAIGVGAAAMVVFAVLAVAWPARRAARVAGNLGVAEFDAQQRPSLVASAISRAGLPVSVVAGSRLALESGRGRTAVPVRSTIAGVTVGIVVLASALTFGTSLRHLLRTPALYGVRWDSFITDYGAPGGLKDHLDEVRSLPGIADLSFGADGELDMGDVHVPMLAVSSVRGKATPPILEGHAPTKPDEIALGRPTARRLRVHLGDRTGARIPFCDCPEVPYTVVGLVVIAPSGGTPAEPGEGALLSLEGLRRIAATQAHSEFGEISDAFLTYARGADRHVVLKSLDAFLATPPSPDEKPESPTDLVNFGRVPNLPVLLAAILGAVAAATLAHTIATGVRRRRGDLAILKTMGFAKGQVRATVAWQATILTVTALFVGIPGGIAFGRWLWSQFAERIGMVPEPVVSALAATSVFFGAVALANLIAALPAIAAARVRPALVLRAE